MPLLGYLLALGFQLPGEVAAGVVLVGCCPGGTASNVLVYLSRGDVTLSVTMTTLSTLLAPLLTPLVFWVFAHQWLALDPGTLILPILQIVLLPIGIGIGCQSCFPVFTQRFAPIIPLSSTITIALIVAAIVGASKTALINHVSQGDFRLLAVVALHNGLGLSLGLGYW